MKWKDRVEEGEDRKRGTTGGGAERGEKVGG